MKTLSVTLLVLVTLAGASLVWAPAPIDEPLAYTPPPAPALSGVLKPNTLLKQAELLGVGQVNGPEDVAVDRDGRIYGGTQDGKIVRIDKTGAVELFATTGGRPLGLHFDRAGNLVVADSYKGLLSIDPKGQVTVLTTEADGLPFRFTDDLDIASDGRIYFTDASAKYSQSQYLYDLMESRPHGRLLVYDPATGQTQTLQRGLFFANGVALSQKEDFVLVNETYRYRIRRHWLKGPRQGTLDTFIDNLPGFPDGVSSNRQGTFWVAMFTVRNPRMDRMHPRPFVKKLVSKMPRWLWPQPAPYGLVLAINEQGEIVRSLHEPDGAHLREITSVQEHEGDLYFGSLSNDRIGRMKAP